MTPADLQHLRALCRDAAGTAIVTLFPVRVLRDLLAAFEAHQKCECGATGPDGLSGRGA
jgi:hypothetical protein